MSLHWKPDGYPSVSPYLIVTGVREVIDFLERAFGASRLRVFEHDDGSIMHAEVRIEDSVVMMGEAGGDWPSVPSSVHVYVEDVDAVYERALAAGGASLQRPVRKTDDPDRRGGVRDPAGNSWWIATQQ